MAEDVGHVFQVSVFYFITKSYAHGLGVACMDDVSDGARVMYCSE